MFGQARFTPAPFAAAQMHLPPLPPVLVKFSVLPFLVFLEFLVFSSATISFFFERFSLLSFREFRIMYPPPAPDTPRIFSGCLYLQKVVFKFFGLFERTCKKAL